LMSSLNGKLSWKDSRGRGPCICKTNQTKMRFQMRGIVVYEIMGFLAQAV
jgi:hypothetical protein